MFTAYIEEIDYFIFVIIKQSIWMKMVIILHAYHIFVINNKEAIEWCNSFLKDNSRERSKKKISNL